MAQRKARDERGAYALLTAILAILLVSIAALAVDIGNAVARQSDVQGQADFAALAAGSQLSGNSGTIPTAVLDAARDSMNENQPVNRFGACISTTKSCVQSIAQLTNGNLTDGEVRWANGGLQVITPMPYRCAVGSTDRSTPRMNREYGGCSVTKRCMCRSRATHWASTIWLAGNVDEPM